MIIKDEIHGTIEFDGLEERIIDSAPFQRLRWIRQMSVTNLVYPGANHTRFEHSLGTAFLSSVMSKKLGLGEDEVHRIRLYALLHDIGHTPFSHEGEDVLREHAGDHEALGEKRILSGEIADILKENFDPRKIIETGKSTYGDIITSDLGADRMDYLKRDAHNTGVAYGIIDIDRIVHTLRMENGRLCIEKGGLGAAEYLLIARFMMFSTVYLHKTVRIATALLYRAIRGTIEEGLIPAEEFARLDDQQAYFAMLGSKKGGKYASMLLQRKLYKEVCSFPRNISERKCRALEKELCAEYEEDIIVDYPHQFFKPVGFMVKTDNGLEPIAELSKLVQSLKKSEEERMRILVLSDEQVKSGFGKRIRLRLGRMTEHEPG